MIRVFKKSSDKSRISSFLLCNYIDLFIPAAILEADRLFNHAQWASLQLAGDKGHTILPGLSTPKNIISGIGIDIEHLIGIGIRIEVNFGIVPSLKLFL